jgi:tRNA 2-selenouridine synthase
MRLYLQVWVESESANIGAVQLPGKVIDSLRRAPRYEVTLPFERRVSATLDEYEELTRQPEHLKSLLAKLKRFLGAKTICEWYCFVPHFKFPRHESHAP